MPGHSSPGSEDGGRHAEGERLGWGESGDSLRPLGEAAARTG